MILLFFQSIFSFRSYHRFSTLGPWKTAFFVFYIWLLGLLCFNIWFTLQLQQQLPAFLKTVPELSFEKGTLTGPEQAVTLAIPQTGMSVVFDAHAQRTPTREDFINRQLLAFVTQNRIYTVSSFGVQSQQLPANFTLHITQSWLQQNMASIRGALQGAGFFGSALAMGLFLLFSFFLAASSVYLWSAWKRTLLPPGTVLRWAAFLQGPALALWLVNLLWGVPLFLFGLFILYMIYIQQIFNLMPEKKR